MSNFELALSSFLLKIFTVELMLLSAWVCFLYWEHIFNKPKETKKKDKEKKLRTDNFPFGEGEEVTY